MLRITEIGNRFALTCMVAGTMVVGSVSTALAAPVSSDDELELMGLVESMPDGGGAGTWVIGGETFTADEDTEIETDDGPLEIGACAEVEYEAGAEGNLALEIEGEDSPDCIDDEEDEDDADDDMDEEDDDDDEDDAAEDDAEDADSTEGDTAESMGGGSAADAGGSQLRLMSNVSGAAQNQDPPDAGGDEAEDPNDAEEDEADEDEDEEGEEDALEHMGLVESMPDGGGAGAWVIGGETFTADENTAFNTDEGVLAVGACAEAEYEAGADGNLALEIEGEDSPDCIDDEEDDADDGNDIFGTIETMPAGNDTPLGTWVIDGVSYVATADTEIEEEYGPFEVGANVELEFEVVDGVNQLTELETEPAPGEAPNTTEGVITSKGGAVVAATVSESSVANGTWVIGNQEYTVLGITAQEGALTVGSMAQVNSYTHADGREIATSIRNVDQNSFIFLPIVLQHG